MIVLFEYNNAFLYMQSFFSKNVGFHFQNANFCCFLKVAWKENWKKTYDLLLSISLNM